MMDINQDTLAKAVGRTIAYQRQQRGMTQEEVAERLQIGMEAVSRMERGIVVPTIVRLAELAQIFGCELTDLLRETSSRPLEQAVRLAHQLEQLTDDDRQWVTDTMTALMSRLIR
ncbi:helix-turn-helix domain-containing protein [Aeromonas dhakensis]|uniref:helix-turn-helix domain-containing protein n=1 Tax=Aeromonas dhakensis TaxID=196024 RepID=UPI002157C62C|nr:helix-turn-helix transcriptional regulator [Aeromonas dhakensis]MCR6737294.1 helix-turn-helix domain-containing protein [Aeromonas dhakensis]